MGIVAQLKEKHKERLARLPQDWAQTRAEIKGCRSHVSDVILFQKWAYRVGKGWYGFALGDVPRVWTDLLDSFFIWLEIQCPDFEIHQVKIKGAGLRLYLGTKTRLQIRDEKIRSEIRQLESLLTTPLLRPPSIGAGRKPRRNHSERS